MPHIRYLKVFGGEVERRSDFLCDNRETLSEFEDEAERLVAMSDGGTTQEKARVIVDSSSSLRSGNPSSRASKRWATIWWLPWNPPNSGATSVSNCTPSNVLTVKPSSDV